MAITTSLFREQQDGRHVSHSAVSALLARDSDVYAYATYMCAKSAPMAMHMAAADKRWGPASKRTYETAYNMAFDTDLPFFEHISRDDAKMSEFAKYMRNVRSSEGVDIQHLVNGFSWQEIPNGGVLVDVSSAASVGRVRRKAANDYVLCRSGDLQGVLQSHWQRHFPISASLCRTCQPT